MNRKFILRFRGLSPKGGMWLDRMVAEFVDGMPARMKMDSATVEKAK